MKPQAVILVLLLALGASIGTLYLQHHRHVALSARQDEAIIQLRKKTDSLLPQALAYQKIVVIRQLSEKARDGARGPADRYRALKTLPKRSAPTNLAKAPTATAKH